MFSTKFQFLAVVSILALSLQVNAHAAIAPALGVSGAPKRSDAQRAKGNCGSTNVAQTINTSTPVVAAADGSFTVTVTNFNGGADGSRKVTGTVDSTGAGKAFKGAVAIATNGDPAPTSNASEQIKATLPAGTQCTGGTNKNLCLVAFTTTAGFGNCVVVQQGGAKAAAPAPAAAPASAAPKSNAASKSTAAGTEAPEAEAPEKEAPEAESPEAEAPEAEGAAGAKDAKNADKAKQDAAKKAEKAKKKAEKKAEKAKKDAGKYAGKAGKVETEAPEAEAPEAEGAAKASSKACKSKANKRDIVGTRAPRALRRLLAEDVE